MSEEAERIYTINLGKVLLSPNNIRAKRAINMIKEFTMHHMKTNSVRISEDVAHYVWKRGIKHPQERSGWEWRGPMRDLSWYTCTTRTRQQPMRHLQLWSQQSPSSQSSRHPRRKGWQNCRSPRQNRQNQRQNR